jgi:cell fate regulator YaaT (PSP1 superfamily)
MFSGKAAKGKLRALRKMSEDDVRGKLKQVLYAEQEAEKKAAKEWESQEALFKLISRAAKSGKSMEALTVEFETAKTKVVAQLAA